MVLKEPDPSTTAVSIASATGRGAALYRAESFHRTGGQRLPTAS